MPSTPQPPSDLLTPRSELQRTSNRRFWEAYEAKRQQREGTAEEKRAAMAQVFGWPAMVGCIYYFGNVFGWW